jgi:hypothetical protein
VKSCFVPSFSNGDISGRFASRFYSKTGAAHWAAPALNLF